MDKAFLFVSQQYRRFNINVFFSYFYYICELKSKYTYLKKSTLLVKNLNLNVILYRPHLDLTKCNWKKNEKELIDIIIQNNTDHTLI